MGRVIALKGPTPEAVSDAEECLAWGHQWDRISGLQREQNAAYRGYRIWWRCMRCATERYASMDVYGRALTAGMTYLYSDAFKQAHRADKRDGMSWRAAQKQQWVKQERRNSG